MKGIVFTWGKQDTINHIWMVFLCVYNSVEVIRLGHSYFINWDQFMFCSKCNTAAEARTTTLSEELGQVSFRSKAECSTSVEGVNVWHCSLNALVFDPINLQRLSCFQTEMISFRLSTSSVTRLGHSHRTLWASKSAPSMDTVMVSWHTDTRNAFYRIQCMTLCSQILP